MGKVIMMNATLGLFSPALVEEIVSQSEIKSLEDQFYLEFKEPKESVEEQE